MLNKKIRLGDLLIEHEFITEEQLQLALTENEKREKKLRLGEILVELELISEELILTTLAEQLGVEYLEPGSFEIDFSISDRLNISSLKNAGAIPIREDEKNCEVLFYDPLDFSAQDVVQRMMPNKNLKIFVTKKKELEASLEKLEQYDGQKEIVEGIRKELAGTLVAEGDESPIMKLIELIIETAIIKKSSDIHIEPSALKCHVRARVDGYLTDIFVFDKDIYPPLASRIKLLANLDIAERRKPQDGRFSKEVNSKEYDFRISTLPITHGESIVFRILDKQNALIKLDEIGFQESNADKFRKAMHEPYGIVFVTGPTGSGKTTTLYAGLNEIKNISKKIITVEDPVEYQMDLIQQVQVNEKAELGFANALRSILRQDPDIIMVGEVRDKETLAIAIQAALTGHLVFTTLHTNDAISAVTRVVDMGIEPLLVANSVVAIQAQRLVRKVCKYCHKTTLIHENLMEKYREYIPVKHNFVRAVGCKRCNNTGYSGRTIISEVLEVGSELAELIVLNASKQKIYETAVKNGFEPMFVSGLQKAAEGVTTIEEVIRVAKLEV